MNAEKVNEILNWLGNPNVLKNLPMDEMLCVEMAVLKMCESIESLYDKHNRVIFKLENLK